MRQFILLTALLFLSAASLGAITVGNPGFEDAAIDPGGYSYDYIPWESLNEGGGYTPWLSEGYYTPEMGTNIMYTTGDNVYQSLTETFVAGATYVFSMRLGLGQDGTSDDWTLYFYDGDATIASVDDLATATLASVSGVLPATPDGSTGSRYSVSYTATAADAGKKIGIGFDGDYYVQFDDAIVEFSGGAEGPDPFDGEGFVEVALDSPERRVSGAASWLAPSDPNIATVFGYNVYLDPNQIVVQNADEATTGLLYKSLQSEGQTGTSLSLISDLAHNKTYYWRVDAIVDYDYVPGTEIADANMVTGKVWTFTTKELDEPPVVEAGDNILTTSALAAAGFELEGTVIDDGTSTLTVGWEAFDVALGGGSTTKVTFTDAADPNTVVTISEAGTYILKLTATDATGTISDQKEIVVYDSACQAAKNTGARTANYYDRNDDCIVDLADFAVFALEWLDSTALSENFAYSGTVGTPSEEALVAEYWTGLTGNDPNTMLDDPDYPNTPDGAYLVTGELRGALSGDSYGQRIYGYLVPPTTGDYTFYIASDDAARLFLSADTNPVDTTPALGNQVAEVPGYTDPDTWDTYPSQTSATVSLTADQYYYIEILHKEGGGADHVSVGWSTDGGTTIEVIPSTALRYALP